MDLVIPVRIEVWALQDSLLDTNKNGSNLKQIREIRPYDKHGKQHRSHLPPAKH